MKWIIITYVYSRFGKWYIWEYVTRTKLVLDSITVAVIKPEIEKKEKVEVIIIDSKYEQ